MRRSAGEGGGEGSAALSTPPQGTAAARTGGAAVPGTPGARGPGEVPAVGAAENRDPRFTQTSFRHPFRRYQQLALERYERGLNTDRDRSYIVMPPGSGKTVVGLEILRRRGHRALVLTPNTAVQAQWLRQWREFTPDLVPTGTDRRLENPLTVLTYQALCNFSRNDARLDERARALWRETIRAEQGLSADQADAEIEALEAAGAAHFRRELTRYRRRIRSLTARGGERHELLALLHPAGRDIVERMKETGPWTLVLDECHHLLEMWGYLVRALVEELGGETFILGLTATPPAELNRQGESLYRELFGNADFQVPTPAVVKEGDLAPYQELVYLTSPLPHEAEYIAAQHTRFEELLDRLLDPEFGSRPFLEWTRVRIEERRTRQGAQVSWARFERDHPELAQAALRLCYHRGLPLPHGARLGERHRRAPDADDWVALIEDYALGQLRSSSHPADEAAWDEIRRALPSLGYLLTRTGIRRHASPVDRVLALSASKGNAAVSILELEAEALGTDLRALVLCDYERAGSELLARLRGILDPQAGSAALLLHLLAAETGVPQLAPILLTGRTVACTRATATTLWSWIEAEVPQLRGTLTLTHLFEAGGPGTRSARRDTTAEIGNRMLRWDDIVVLRPTHPWWRPRHYVPLLTRYFEEGGTRCLIGTRGLLGEGWDAKRVNVLLDLTAATTSTSVHQARGRSLRLDEQLPRKVANNWDIICVDPEHPRGAADYDRFVRKHRHYHAPTVAGEIESGVTHVHPALSPFGPPPTTHFGAINRNSFARAQDREAAYARWRIGEPYHNLETHTVRLRAMRSLGLPGRQLLRRADAADPRPPLRRHLTDIVTLAGLLGLGVRLAAGTGISGIKLGLGAIGLLGAWAATTLAHRMRRVLPSAALEDLAAALAEALAETGAIRPELGPSAVRVSIQEDGFYRCFLAGATEEESRRFAEALDELLSPLAAPRYIIPRLIAERPETMAAALRVVGRLTLTGHVGNRVVYHTVPTYLATNKQRVEAFRRAWERHVSPGEPLFWKEPRAEAILEVQRGEDPFEIETQMRVVWQ